MRIFIWAILIAGGAAIAAPFAFSNSERAGHILAAHCVDALRDYVGEIRDIKVTVWPLRAVRPSDEERVRRVHGRYIDLMSEAGYGITTYAPVAYIEYRQGAAGQRVDASCDYAAVSLSDEAPGEVTLTGVIARTEILRGPYKAPLNQRRLSYSSVANQFLVPFHWLRYRATVSKPT